MGNIPTYVYIYTVGQYMLTVYVCMHVCMYEDCVYSMYCILSYTSTSVRGCSTVPTVCPMCTISNNSSIANKSCCFVLYCRVEEKPSN